MREYEFLRLDVETLGLVGGDVDLLERLIRDGHAEDNTASQTH